MNLDGVKKVLDLGCGYGPIGIAAAKLSPRSEVVMVDVNSRACELARENVTLNRLANAREMCIRDRPLQDAGPFIRKVSQLSLIHI